jgi:hypothetical protein
MDRCEFDIQEDWKRSVLKAYSLKALIGFGHARPGDHHRPAPASKKKETIL